MYGFTIIRKDSEAVIIYKPVVQSVVHSSYTFRSMCISVQLAICSMTLFYYFYQNASVFCFLVQIRPSAVLILAGISTFKYEKKHEMYLGFTISKHDAILLINCSVSK